MNIKTTLGLVAVLILIMGGYFFFSREVSAPADTSLSQVSSPEELLKNATFKVPDTDTVVTLKEGSAMFDVAPDAYVTGSVTLAEGATALWQGKGRSDLSTVIAVNTGGTGIFLYLVLFDVSDTVLTEKSFIFLGDRIGIDHIGVGELVHGNADYRLTLQTREREENEAYAAVPTVPRIRTFYVTDQLLEEVETDVDDS